MATRNSRSSKRGAPSPKDPASDPVKLSPAYYKELEDTFQLYDEGSGRLSIKKLRLAMRTLGFEASIDDIQEIIQEMPALSIHKATKTQTSRQHGGVRSSKSSDSRRGKGVKKIEVKGRGSSPALQDARRSTRVAAVASRTGERSNYVDSDDNDNGSSGADDDTYVDGEKGSRVQWESQSEQGDTELSFTFEDFVTIMTPGEKQHGLDEISRVFQMFDTQGKGFLCVEDLRRIATELNMPFNDEELREMIEETARDVDSGVTEQDFVKIMAKTGF